MVEDSTEGGADLRPGRRSRALMIGGVAVLIAGCVAVAASMWFGDESSPIRAGLPPLFIDEAVAAGVDHTYSGDVEFFVGGGVAAFDCSDDGRPDLFFAGGSEPAALFRNQSTVTGPLDFERVASPVTDLSFVTGAYPLDIDNDMVTDLVVLRRGANVVLRGLGDCRFEPITDRLGLDVEDRWTTAFSATWETSNALPTLAFGNYLVPDGDTTCDTSELVRPDPNGTTYAPPIDLAPGYCTLSMLFSDWARSGERDLRVANDRNYYRDGSDQLWRIVAGEPPREYTLADGWLPLQVWGMGIASRDLTGDGYPEVFVTSQGDNKLQMLADGAGQPTYRDGALRAGVTAQRPVVGGDVLPSTAWHPEFADVNNDGVVDLFITKGNVEAQPGYAVADPNNLFLGQPDGTFVEGAEAAGIVGFERSRGAAVVDLNLDGLLDLVVVDRRENVELWRNVGSGDAGQPRSMGNWLALQVRQSAPNTAAVGAWLEIEVGGTTSVREITVGGGHVSGEAGWIHTGLGSEDTARVRVQWPDGEVGPWLTVDANEFFTVERGSPVATRWLPDPTTREPNG